MANNRMLRNENSEDIENLNKKKRKSIIFILIGIFIILFSLYNFLRSDVVIEYDDIENGITVEQDEQGFYIFKGRLPLRARLCGGMSFIEDDYEDGLQKVERQIYFITTRFDYIFGEWDVRAIYAVSPEGRETSCIFDGETAKIVDVKIKKANVFSENGDYVVGEQVVYRVLYQRTISSPTNEPIGVGESHLLWECKE